MATPGWLSRRRFVKAAALTALSARSQWLRAKTQTGSALSFVSTMGDAAQPHGIHVFAMQGNAWKPLSFTPSESPIALALHPSGNYLYVLNELQEYKGLPTGTIEAFKVDKASGQFTLLNRQLLALSATMPRHLAVSPSGNMIVIAVHGGGAYNVLPILGDGSVGCVISAMKETGCGPISGHQNSAHPQSVLFDPTGNRVVATDLGCDRLRVFSITESDSSMAFHLRVDLQPGSAPKHIALHPSGNFLYVDHAFDNSISGFHYDPATGHIGERFIRIHGAFGDALAIHPREDFLYSSFNGKLSVWQIQSETGALHPKQSIELSADTVRGISPLLDGSIILALTSSGVQRLDIDTTSGRLANPVIVAPITGARSIAM